MRQICEQCGKTFDTVRAKCCSAKCRVDKSRGVPAQGPVGDAPPLDPDCDTDGLVSAVTAELAAAGRVNSVPGQQALLIARQMTGSYQTVSGMSTMSKELSRLVAEAKRGAVAKVLDPVDEVKARRDAKRAG